MCSPSPAQTPRTDRRRPAAAGARRGRDLAVALGLAVLFLAGVAGLAAATGWQETLAQMSRLTVAQAGLLLATALFNYLMRGLRWHLFARAIGLRTGLLQNLRHFLGGFAMSVTPGRLGELVRMRWIGRETGWRIDRTAPLMLVDRAADLAAMGILIAVGVAVAATGIAGALPVAGLALLAAWAATSPRLLAAIVTRGYRSIGRWPRLFARVRAAARKLGAFAAPSLLGLALLLGALGWLAEGWGFHLLLGWMGAEVGLAKAITIFIFATLAGGLTGAPGGLGGAEATMIALLGLEGVPMDIALPATIIIRVTTLWFALLVGLLVFPAAEHYSRKGQHALEIR